MLRNCAKRRSTTSPEDYANKAGRKVTKKNNAEWKKQDWGQAEDILGVDSDALTNLKGVTPDWQKLISMFAAIEPLCRETLKVTLNPNPLIERLIRFNFRTSLKIIRALVPKEELEMQLALANIDTLARVRHAYAHNICNMELSFNLMLEKLKLGRSHKDREWEIFESGINVLLHIINETEKHRDWLQEEALQERLKEIEEERGAEDNYADMAAEWGKYD